MKMNLSKTALPGLGSFHRLAFLCASFSLFLLSSCGGKGSGTDFSIESDSTDVAVGGRLSLRLVGTNSEHAWRSSAPAVATVSSDGTVHGISVGQVWITAETAAGEKEEVLVSVRRYKTDLSGWIARSMRTEKASDPELAEPLDLSDMLSQAVSTSAPKEKPKSVADATRNKPNPAAVKPKEDAPKPSSSSLSVGNGVWTGKTKHGKPDGFGRMTFRKAAVIEPRDPQGRRAEAGDYVEGRYKDGHLVSGTWHKAATGETEFMDIGGR